MMMLPASVRIFLYEGPTDMRRGFDSLAALVRQAMGMEPLSGHLFVFRNRRGDHVKLLWWDRDGWCLWHKRLEKGCFTALSKSGEITACDLALLLEGIDPGKIRRRARFALSPTATGKL